MGNVVLLWKHVRTNSVELVRKNLRSELSLKDVLKESVGFRLAEVRIKFRFISGGMQGLKVLISTAVPTCVWCVMFPAACNETLLLFKAFVTRSHLSLTSV